MKALTMEGRMTLCNMAIEMGAKVGMVAPDEVTFEYVKGRLFAPKGAEWDEAVAYWKTLSTDEDAQFDKEVVLDAAALEPQVTWGTNPGQEAPSRAASQHLKASTILSHARVQRPRSPTLI